MISAKKLIRMARKWQKVVALGRKSISLQRINMDVDADSCNTSTMADKDHFVIYSSARRHFMIPLAYLDSEIFKELFQMSEEEFRIQSEGPIILSCDSVFMLRKRTLHRLTFNDAISDASHRARTEAGSGQYVAIACKRDAINVVCTSRLRHGANVLHRASSSNLGTRLHAILAPRATHS